MKGREYKIFSTDPLLTSYQYDISLRMRNYTNAKQQLTAGKPLGDFANAHLYYGFHQDSDVWYYREWAPGARSIHLFGDFNDWNRTSHPMRQIYSGVWELAVSGKLPHASKVRIQITTEKESLERIPIYCRRVVQNSENLSFDGQIWQPDKPYEWGCQSYHLDTNASLLIYECHVGISSEEEKVSTYCEFTENILPRIHSLGYNAIQLMGIMEHPYYGSFGYQVSNFYAASSRFGTPEDLKHLVDTAHQMGIAVFLDLIHSHAACNEVEGLSRFDGTDYQFFHTGTEGYHPQWKTRLFDYQKQEVLHFLLSNLKFWLEEYHFDGFRFDGVTSMIYHNHGIDEVFDSYDKYFSLNTCTEAITYLQLATELCKSIKPDCVLIAEDMSGMPGMCLPIEDGGIGFDYRLGMGLPDYWIRILKELTDEQWSMGQLWYELVQRRPQEKVIGYCESHDQAFVGDKTLMFRMADKEMYWNMDKTSQNIIVERAMALHKMIRLITCLCAGEGYLNFMGNEFGHPEWIDLPREGNSFSCHYARRLWSLADNSMLRYQDLQNFDKAMISLVKDSKVIRNTSVALLIDESSKIIIFRKKQYLCAFNFHPTKDATREIVLGEKSLCCVLDTNQVEFGGWKTSIPKYIYSENGKFSLTIEKRSGIIWVAEA